LFAAIIATLAVAIGGNAMMCSWIEGVAPPSFIGTFVGYSLDLWTPTAMEQAFFPGGDHRSNRAHPWLEGYARLRPGITPARAQADLDAISRRIERRFPARTSRGCSRARSIDAAKWP
jgi:hypothetical protein